MIIRITWLTIITFCLILLAGCKTEATETPTPTPEDDLMSEESTAPEPLLQPTRSALQHGVMRVPPSDWPTVREELRASIVDYIIYPTTDDGDILILLDRAQDLGLSVLLHIYDNEQPTGKPWFLDRDRTWHITPRGEEILALIEDHPAVWAIYMLHEPFDSAGYHANADAQRALYTFLKRRTSHLLYSDLGSLSPPTTRGQQMSDGMCDICATFPTTFRGAWTTRRSLAETFRRIDRDLAVQQRDMPNSRLVCLINVYRVGSGRRYEVPTAEELRAVRDYLAERNILYLYYPWEHNGYDVTLSNQRDLWSAIAEGPATSDAAP